MCCSNKGKRTNKDKNASKFEAAVLAATSACNAVTMATCSGKSLFLATTSISCNGSFSMIEVK